MKGLTVAVAAFLGATHQTEGTSSAICCTVVGPEEVLHVNRFPPNWAKETRTRRLFLNTHTHTTHTKRLVVA